MRARWISSAVAAARSRGRGAAPLGALALLALLLPLALAGCGAQAGDWRLIGPASGAHVYTIAADPHAAGLIYAGADDGGVYRVRADTQGNVLSGAGIPSSAVVASLAPDQQRAGVVLAGTSAGLYRSADYGDTWRAYGAGLPRGSAAVALAATPDDAVLLAGIDHGGLYRSVDSGATWTSAASGLPSRATPVALLWDASAHLWLLGLVATSQAPLYASADGGQTWAPRVTGLPAKAQVNALALLPATGSASPALFAATTSGLYTSVNAGQSWSYIAGLPQGSALALATLTQQPTWLYASVGSGVFRSMDGGAQWQTVARGLTSDAQGLAVTQEAQSGTVVFAAAGQVARYPSGATAVSGFSVAALLTIIALALIIGGYFISRRMRRFGYAMGANRNESNTGRAAEASARWTAEEAQRSATPLARRENGADSTIAAPSRPASSAPTGVPASPQKAAQNGNGKRKRRK
jgi:hypothetical protein